MEKLEKLVIGQEYIFTIDGIDHIGVWQGIGISKNERVAKIIMVLISGKKVVCDYFIDHINFVRKK